MIRDPIVQWVAEPLIWNEDEIHRLEQLAFVTKQAFCLEASLELQSDLGRSQIARPTCIPLLREY